MLGNGYHFADVSLECVAILLLHFIPLVSPNTPKVFEEGTFRFSYP